MMRSLSALLVPFAVTALLAAQGDEKPPAQDPKATAEQMLKSAEEVQKQVEELRGYKFKTPVAKAVYTKDQLRDYLAVAMEKELGKGKLERMEAWLKCLGLLQGDVDLRKTMTEVLLSQIGGFYDPEKQSFFMMAEASAFGDVLNRMMIAHELCHALDDQYVDLRKLQKPSGREPTEDEGYVVGGVCEGSATALMTAWMQKAVQGGAKMADLAGMGAQQKEQMQVLLDAPPYCALLAANYMVGQHFVTKGAGLASAATGADTGAAINEAAKDMPRSSEQLLHPEKYWDPKKRDEPVVLKNRDELQRLVEQATGHVVVEHNTLGELVVALVAGPQKKKLNAMLMARPDYWTNKAAKGWGGDHVLLVGKEKAVSGQPVAEAGVVWVTAWDSEEDRTEFVEAVTKYRAEQPGFTVAADGKVAVFAFGSARTLDAAALGKLLAACTFEQDGKPWAR